MKSRVSRQTVFQTKLQFFLFVQLVLVMLAAVLQLDLLLVKGAALPGLLFGLAGLLGSLLIAWLVTPLLLRRFQRDLFRLISPFWIGLGLAALVASGIWFCLSVNVPMDWRPVLLAGLVATLPGSLLGGLLSRRISRDLIENEPTLSHSRAVLLLNKHLDEVKQMYPKADGQVYISDENLYMATVRVPRTGEELVFYVSCDEEYPAKPPTAIAVELVLANGKTDNVRYEAPIVYYWNAKYGLRHIIEEALQILNH